MPLSALIVVCVVFGLGEAVLSRNVNRVSSKAEDSRRRGRALSAFRLAGWCLAVYVCVSMSVLFGDIKVPFILIIAVISLGMYLLYRGLPWRIARYKTSALEKIYLPFGRILSFILTPILSPLAFLSKLTDRLFSALEVPDPAVTEEEIREMLMAGGEESAIEEQEKEMINNVFEFNNTIVEEVFTHRRDIFALPVESTFEDIIRAAAEERYTRLPVYSGSIDDILGILHTKDIFRLMLNKNEPLKNESFNLEALLHKAYFVPLSKTTDELFNEMRKKKVHIAIVVDEYGGTAGIVTMEDLIEEVMGSIQDEYDEEERPDIRHIHANVYETTGAAELDIIADFFKKDFPTDDYDTLGGFLIAQLGRVPGEDECPELEYQGLVFKVHNIEDRRIESVIIYDTSMVSQPVSSLSEA